MLFGGRHDRSKALYTSPIYEELRETTTNCCVLHHMESQDLRLPGRRVLLCSDVRCYECSVRRSIVMSVPFSGTAVKHGKLPVSISSII